jgi:hypothetical protein
LKQLITFKHYRTQQTITKLCEVLPQYNKQKQSEVLIVYNHDDDHIEAIVKSTIQEIGETNE